MLIRQARYFLFVENVYGRNLLSGTWLGKQKKVKNDWVKNIHDIFQVLIRPDNDFLFVEKSLRKHPVNLNLEVWCTKIESKLINC